MTDKCVWLKSSQILFGKYCVSITRQWLNVDSGYCLASITGRSFGRPFRVYDMWIKMCITCEPITYFMLNRMERITDDRITCGILYVYIKIYDILTDLKGSEGPRITVIYSNFLGYGSLFGQGSIPTYYHFSPLSPQNDAGISTINKY